MIREERVYMRWNKSVVKWMRIEKFDYIEPVNIRYGNSEKSLLSDMCEYYKEKLIFENI
jgi:hypothetical protein